MTDAHRQEVESPAPSFQSHRRGDPNETSLAVDANTNAKVEMHIVNREGGFLASSEVDPKRFVKVGPRYAHERCKKLTNGDGCTHPRWHCGNREEGAGPHSCVAGCAGGQHRDDDIGKVGLGYVDEGERPKAGCAGQWFSFRTGPYGTDSIR